MDEDRLLAEIERISDPLRRLQAMEKLRSLKGVMAETQLKVLKSMQARGSVIPLADAQEYVAGMSAGFRAALKRFADTHSHALAQMEGDPAAVHAYLVKAGDRLLDSLREQVETPQWVDDADQL